MSHSFPSLPGDEYANARTPQSLRNPGHIEPQNCRSFTRSLVDRSQGSWPKEWTAAAAIVAHHLQEKVKVYDKPRSGVMMGTIKLEVDSLFKVQALAKHDNTTITTVIKWLNPDTTRNISISLKPKCSLSLHLWLISSRSHELLQAVSFQVYNEPLYNHLKFGHIPRSFQTANVQYGTYLKPTLTINHGRPSSPPPDFVWPWCPRK